MVKNKPSLLAVLHLPPPIHGASMVGQYIKDSVLLNDTFETTFVNLTTSASIDDIGKGFFKKLVPFFKLYFRVFNLLLKNKYDLCYMTINAKGVAFYKEMIVVLIVKMFKVKIIYHYHNKGIKDSKGNWLNNILYKYQFRNAKAILLSPLLYDDISSYLPHSNVSFCPNGIVERKESTLKQFNKFKNTIPEILFLSNMMETKGVYCLLDACTLLHKKDFDFTVNFVGAESDITANDFNAYVKKNDLQNKAFYLGKKYGDEKNVFFENSNVFVLPTYYHNECFPLVILEAMSYGLSCISTNEGAIPEIIDDGITGFIVPKNNAEILASKIELLLLNDQLCEKMGNASKEKFNEKYTLSVFEKNFVEILSKN